MMISRRKFNRLTGLSLTASFLVPVHLSAGRQAKRLKVGQIGTGHSHADGKIETLRRLDDIYEFVGVAENDPALREKNSRLPVYKGLKWLSENELLEIPGLQAVLIETDLPDLLPIAERCIAAGLPIHLDKPPGKNYPRFEQIIRSAAEKNLIVQMGYMFRYNPAFEFCLYAVRSGWLGEIFEIDGVISKTISAERRRPLVDTYQGSMMLLGCHLVDMVVAILGAPVRVDAYRRQTLVETDKLYDNELAVLEYPAATATVRSALVEVEGWERRQFVVCGTKGTIEIKPLEPPHVRLALTQPVDPYIRGYQEVTMPPEKERYDDQLIDFARMVQGAVKPRYTMQHDLTVQKTVLEAAGLFK